MPYELDGKTIETTANGYLVDPGDWSEALAAVIAASQDIELTARHLDVLRYLREQWFDHGQNQPNDRTILKEMGARWGEPLTSKELYDLFPHQPSKQGGLLAGLPESRRKGGY